MDIKEYDWIKDVEGNPTAHGAFVLKPSDLLKFGEIMSSGGWYKDPQMVSQAWVEESLQEGQNFLPIWGLLWWRLPAFEKRIIDSTTLESWKNGKVSPSFIDTLAPLTDQLFENKQDFYEALEALLGADWKSKMYDNLPGNLPWSRKVFSEKITAYYAAGHRGNYLVILPKHHIVAVRCADPEGFNYETDFFHDFVELVAKLVSGF